MSIFIPHKFIAVMVRVTAIQSYSYSTFNETRWMLEGTNCAEYTRSALAFTGLACATSTAIASVASAAILVDRSVCDGDHN